jgi:hypothetical protein
MNQRRSASSNPSVVFSSLAQATQASGRISIEGPVSTATQRILRAKQLIIAYPDMPA